MRLLDIVPTRRSIPQGMLPSQLGSGVDLLAGLLGGSVGVSTPAGVFVDRTNAESVTAFWRGAQIIATAVGALPILVYQRDSEGRKVPVYNERERVIWDKPNPEVSRSTFWMDAVLRCVTTGDWFCRVVTVADPQAQPKKRRPIELWPIESQRVTVCREESGQKLYVIDHDFEHPLSDFTAGGTMVHVQGPSSNGLRGNPPVLQFARTLGLAIAEEIYQSSLLGNGTQLNGYLSSDQPLTLAQAEEAVRLWDERHAGAGKAGRTAALGRGVKWMTSQLNAVDVQLLESRAFSLSEIARIHGVPEWMIGAHTKDSSWGSGLEEQFRTFLVLTLQGWVNRFQETISDELLVQRNHFAEFDTNRLTRGKLADQVASVKGLVQAGYDPAESLAVVGMPPITHTGIVPAGASVADAGPPPEPPRAELPPIELPPIDLTVNVDLPAVQITNQAARTAPRTITKHVIRDDAGNIREVREEEG